MKKLFIVFAILVFLASCSKDEKKNSTRDSTKKDTTQKIADTIKQEQKIDKEESLNGVIYDIKDIPKDIKYTGKIVTAAEWKDNNGENYLVITETEPKENSNTKAESDQLLSKELYVYNYAVKDGQTTLLWKIQDFVKDCEFDLTLEYIKKSLSVTDLNKNGIAETTFLYKLSCRSDPTPADLKLIMHEGKTKYAIRGTAIVKLEKMVTGGEMNVDKSFNSAPAGFLDYAKKQWNIFQEEKFDFEME
jgi:hypothetical protein